MKNKFILPIIFLIAWPVILYSQTTTISIGNVTANPGDNINVPVDVSNFTDIAAITLYIGYNPAVLSFQGLNNINPEVAGISGNAMTNPDQIGLVWTANPPGYANIVSGKLLDLSFTYIGGSCDLVFNAGCEIVNSNLVTIPVNYSDGSVGPNAQPATATIGNVTAYAGNEVFVPVDVTDFSDIGAITFFITFDESVLTFIGLENIHADLAGVQGNVMSNPTRIGIVWSANPPNYLNITTDKLFDLKFVYHGGTSDMNFTEDCEVTDSGLIPVSVSYFGGSVSQDVSSITAELGNVSAAIGQEILVPLDVNNFVDVAAITFYIGYDPSVLSFIGLENIDPGVVGILGTTLTNPNQVSIVWTASPPNYLSFTGKLCDLKFVYNGGSCSLPFDPGCEVTNSSMVTLPVMYADGSVTQATDITTISIDTVYSNTGFEVLVPVNATDFFDVGALTLFIGYEPAALSFVGLENVNPQLSGIVANTMTGPDQIAIAWTANDPNYANIADDKLFDLKFVFSGENGELSFNPGCELTNSILVVIPTTLYDGGVFEPVYLNLKAFLQGPFNGIDLDNAVNGLIPLNQSYNGLPWSYQGLENVPVIPDPDIVDWILIELRETSGDASTATTDKIVALQAGFIFTDGTIVGHATLTPIRFDIVVEQDLYVVIWHRSHLGIMSSVPLIKSMGIYTYNFAIGQHNQAYGTNSQVNVGRGKWAMIAGDGDANGNINLDDKTNYWNISVGKSGYLEGDFNMDGQVDNRDKLDIWINNSGSNCMVPE